MASVKDLYRRLLATPFPRLGGLVGNFLLYDSALAGLASSVAKVSQSMKLRPMWKPIARRFKLWPGFAQARTEQRMNRNSWITSNYWRKFGARSWRQRAADSHDSRRCVPAPPTIDRMNQRRATSRAIWQCAWGVRNRCLKSSARSNASATDPRTVANPTTRSVVRALGAEQLARTLPGTASMRLRGLPGVRLSRGPRTMSR